ncbi:collagenase-like [Maniola hyperantus]|uniref:collagenase-like n=1 Tax=Aphantopus hyperantus TaxID=2795564 RepID=UPI001569D1C7|nr:collagenase-like [Maniola hyperantus]
MAAGRALVVVLALSWANALPTPSELDFVENVRDVGMPRIVSGWEAEEGQIPYQLSLRMVARNGAVFSCGATIIHSEWGLTAAHCTADRVTIVIRAGGRALSRPQLLFETTDYYNHPEYDESLTRVQPHDIGVIKFNQVLEFNDLVQPIRLQASAHMNKNYDGIRLQTSGWGRTWTNGVGPEVLNWVYLLGTSNERCRAAFGGSTIVVNSTICASNYNVTSQSTCQGDSGGPLVVIDVDGVPSEVGVTSFVSGTGCHTGFPAGFIRPGHYHRWLTEVTGVHFNWDPPSTTPRPPTTPEEHSEEDDDASSSSSSSEEDD